MKYNKKIIYLLIIVAIILISIVGAISYGYFNSDLENKIVGNYVVELGDAYSLSTYANPSNEITISDNEMFGQNIDVEVLNETTTLTIELKNDDPNQTIKCTFNYKWRWDSTKDNYTASDSNTPEYLVSGPFTETQVPNYNEDKVLGTGSIVANPNETKTEKVDITTKFYNLSTVDQAIHAGKSYKGGVVIDNVQCIYEKTGAETIASLVGQTLSAPADRDGTTYDGVVVNENGIRYEGVNPNNYVCLDYVNGTCPDDNLYRIIGVFAENTHGRTGETLIKLVKATPYTSSAAWDENNLNDWNNATLKNELNTAYYNRLSSNAKNRIQDINWKLGAMAGTVSITTPEAYSLERSNQKAAAGSATIVSIDSLPIGLAYPSDYGYAVKKDSCARSTPLYNYTTRVCHEQNWMFSTLQASNYSAWLLSPSNATSRDAFQVITAGLATNYYDVTTKLAASPSLYLKTDVKITEGNGTKTTPYILG